MGKLWWDFAHISFLEDIGLEQIAWAEFREFLYSEYFSATIKTKKEMKFLSLHQIEGTLVEEFQSKFLMLERFAPGRFTLDRKRAAQFVTGLHINLRSVVTTF